MKIIRHSFPRRVLIGSVLLLLSPFGWAVQSAPTSTVQGRAPVAAPSITGTTGIGGTLTGVSGFTDADGDSELGTTYSWTGGGTSGSASTLVIPPAAGANTITLTVTPKTDATVTDPAVGVAQAVTVDIPASLGAFLKPDTIPRNWSDADAYCTGLGGGARLPTSAELQDLFLSATGATVLGSVNQEMCNIHDWPLEGQCGGSTYRYWSSTSLAMGRYNDVHLISGEAYSSTGDYTIQVACVR